MLNVIVAGYCSDTVSEDKLKEKELQHTHLQEVLPGYGYEVIAVPGPIIVGFYGTMFTTTVQSAHIVGGHQSKPWVYTRPPINQAMRRCISLADILSRPCRPFMTASGA